MLSIVGARRWIATIMVLWGIASTAAMFAVGRKPVCAALVGITEAGFCGNIALFNLLVPGIFFAPANALFI